MRFLLLIFFSISIYASERVIALSPSINEIIFALGKGDTIIGNTKYCTYPKEAKSISKVGGYYNVSLEKVLALNPDMIMMQSYDKKLINSLKQLGIKTMVLEFNTLDNLLNNILKIARYYNEEKRANRIINSINESLKKTKSIVKNRTIMMVISATNQLNKQIFIIGHNVYLEDIILYSGNKNAYFYGGNHQPAVNIEKIITLNPDIIVLMAPYLKHQKFSKDELINTWKTIPINASKNDMIYVIDKEYVGIPSPRVEFLINDFKEILLDVKSKSL